MMLKIHPGSPHLTETMTIISCMVCIRKQTNNSIYYYTDSSMNQTKQIGQLFRRYNSMHHRKLKRMFKWQFYNLNIFNAA